MEKTASKKSKTQDKELLQKSPTGINGFDEITHGGLPKGRTTLICGAAGCGKSLMAMEYLVHGARDFNEPGVFLAFEETEPELITNVASLGFDLSELIDNKMLLLDHIHLEPSEIEETGEYDLEGLFVRLNYAIDSIGAKRVVLDTIESLFSGFGNPLILRAELRRLFHWLKDKGVTSIITGERGEKSLTRQGLEEYVSDCVILLDHRVKEESSTRRLRIIKYRGSMHGTNEYPFLIDSTGFSVFPITSLGLSHTVSDVRISSGIPRLDEMLENKGFYKGSSILASGTAGTGKSSFAASFAVASCERGERVLYFSLEESQAQITRNMRSIGLNMEKYSKNGLLKFHTMRPVLSGLEMHLTTIHKEINNFKPGVVIIDPINSFVSGDNALEAKSLSIRLIDFMKMNEITAFLVSLSKEHDDQENTNIFISSLIDTWILLRDIENNGERNRGLYILKSRGMAHSNQIREFLLTDHGIELLDVYIGSEAVMTGSSRLTVEAKERATRIRRGDEIKLRELILEGKRKEMEARIAAIKAEFETEETESKYLIEKELDYIGNLKIDENKMASKRRLSDGTKVKQAQSKSKKQKTN